RRSGSIRMRRRPARISRRPELARDLALQPALVEALDVGEVLVHDGVARGDGFGLEEAAGEGAVELAELLPVAVGVAELGVDLAVEGVVVADEHRDGELPVLVPA